MPGGYQRIGTFDLKPIVTRQALTVTNAAGGVVLTVPTTAVSAHCRLETAEIRFTLDGTAPTAAVGTLLEVGEVLELDNPKEMSGVKFFRTGGTSGVLQVEYFAPDI